MKKYVSHLLDKVFGRASIMSERTSVSDSGGWPQLLAEHIRDARRSWFRYCDDPAQCLWCPGGPRSWRHAFGFARRRYVVPRAIVHAFEAAAIPAPICRHLERTK